MNRQRPALGDAVGERVPRDRAESYVVRRREARKGRPAASKKTDAADRRSTIAWRRASRYIMPTHQPFRAERGAGVRLRSSPQPALSASPTERPVIH